MSFDHADLPGLLRRTTYVEVLFHVCLGTGADFPFPAGRKEFLAGVREAIQLDQWQFAILRELAFRSRHVMRELISRLAQRHAAVVARLEQRRDADRAAADLSRGLDAVIAATGSVRRELASHLTAGQLLRLCRGPSRDWDTRPDTEWIRSALEMAEGTEATDRGTAASPGPATPMHEVVPEVILSICRRQAPFLLPVRGAGWIHSPQALCCRLAGRVTSGPPPSDCSLAELMPLFLLVPGLL